MTARPHVLYAGLHLLDRQLVDADGMLAGKVDDLELEPDGTETDGTGPPPPLIVRSICFGHGALWRRLGSGRLGSWLEQRHDHPRERIAHLPLSRVDRIGPSIVVTARHEDLATYDTEQWVRDHVTAHIKGSTHATE